MLDGLDQGDVLLADRGFCSYGLIGVLLARGVDCVMRLHQKRSHDAHQGQPLGPGDRLVEWTRPRDPRRNDPWAAERPTLPATLTVRLVSFRIEVPGFRTEAITLATTLLDAKRYPAQALAELYRARWNIELRYREIKTTMGADILRCKSPAMIEKELCLHAIAYNLLRCVMQQAAQRHEVEWARISFKGALDALRTPSMPRAANPAARAGSTSNCLVFSPKTLCRSVPTATNPAPENDAPSNTNSSTNPAPKCAPSLTKTAIAPLELLPGARKRAWLRRRCVRFFLCLAALAPGRYRQARRISSECFSRSI